MILVGRNHGPVSETVRAVLGIRGEPGDPDDAGEGPRLVEHREPHRRARLRGRLGLASSTSTASLLASPPVVALAAAERSNCCRRTRRAVGRTARMPIAATIGVVSITGEDDAFFAADQRSVRAASSSTIEPLVVGRSQSGTGRSSTAIGRDLSRTTTTDSATRSACRAVIGSSCGQTGSTCRDRRDVRRSTTSRAAGLSGTSTAAASATAFETPLSIAFAFVATHNHFVLDRGGKVFKQIGAGHQASRGRDGGRPPRTAGRAELFRGVLLAQAELPQQGQTVATARGSRETRRGSDATSSPARRCRTTRCLRTCRLQRGRRLDALAQQAVAQRTGCCLPDSSTPSARHAAARSRRLAPDALADGLRSRRSSTGSATGCTGSSTTT